jgi:hypothetical protein
VVKAIFEIGAAILLLVGGIIGAYGSYLVTKWYHPFRGEGFLVSVAEVVWKVVTGRRREAVEKMEFTAELAEGLNPDDKKTSVAGVYLIFIGVALQAFGAMLATADAVIQNLCPNS